MKKSAADRILMFLKMRGEATSLLIAEELSVTKEGARKHLLNLAQEGLIQSTVKSEGVGRPSTYYTLTEKGLAQFPDTHADVTVQLLKSVKNLLGENALDLLISDREKNTHDRYEKALSKSKSIEQRLEVLAKVRSDEGYMAEWKKEGQEYFLIENHCPICAAATECQGFCRAELSNFQSLIGKDYIVERIDHIISGGQRCVYKISNL
ncbi:helix-turn-helix transcriptional regulator [Chryseobacterium sp. YR221]|uniref:helix-turn-helix transcriptional regulator n=1 Tax=Chryseobacterium sp. YR221 TaxID=1500293 RepID=UPI0009D876A7|nr:metalloregulator ArsR/SmtB family transcription factor [Chryseobacterium sp. YR221]SMC40119.1 Predicted transcriptional regulator, ArsR family [Chryseobacterium sp. YR221]